MVSGISSSMDESIGTWSVAGPLRLGSVVHEAKLSAVWSVQNTLSTLVQFFILDACRVGVSLGSGMYIE